MGILSVLLAAIVLFFIGFIVFSCIVVGARADREDIIN